MSKYDENEDKRRRRFIGWIFGSVALAGLFAVGGFLLGNATASSALGSDNTNVLAQAGSGCLNTAESATYLATSQQSNLALPGTLSADTTSQDAVDGTNLGSGSGVDPVSGFSFDTVITDNGDGGTVTPTPDPTVTPDPTITPDPTPTPDPAPQPGDDCDHSGHGEHDGHGDHEESDGHHEGDHLSGDC